jgi:5-methylcytosine-specific restriction endonuclease McrA
VQVLVLDVGYQPIQRVPWETAIVWVLERLVEVVDEHPDRYINTVSWRVAMPSVVRFLRPISKKRAVKFSRHNIYARDGRRCQYCRARVSRDAFTYDHVVPRSQGGATCWENVVVACTPCNQRKANRTPEQAGMRLHSRPVKPKKVADAGLAIAFQEGMPEGWRAWLRDASYWEGELEHD